MLLKRSLSMGKFSAKPPDRMRLFHWPQKVFEKKRDGLGIKTMQGTISREAMQL